MTVDKAKLKALKAIAETCNAHQPLRFMRSHSALYIRNDNGIVFDVHQNRSFPEFMAQNKDYAELVLAANPAAVLALLAEVERLERVNRRQSETIRQYQDHFEGGDSILSLTNERDQLKTGSQALRKYGEEFAVLAERRREEAEALRKDLESHKRMLLAAACDVGAIGQALGADEDDDGSEIEGLAQEVRKDAERYRWTSTEGNWVARFHGKWRAHVGEYGDRQPTDWYPSREEAIDAAMSKGEQP